MKDVGLKVVSVDNVEESVANLIQKLRVVGMNACVEEATDRYQIIETQHNGAELDSYMLIKKGLKDFSSLFFSMEYRFIDVTDLDMSEAVAARNMFKYCDTKEVRGFENVNTGNVQDMTSMFAFAEIYSINFSNFDTHSCKKMCQMFQSWDKIPVLDLTSMDTSAAEDMSWMFNETSISELKINFDTSNVKFMIGMFEHCNIKEISSLAFNTDNVTDMLGMFNRCEISTVDLSTFTFTKCESIKHFFREAKVGTIIMPKTNIPNNTEIDYCFCGTDAEQAIVYGIDFTVGGRTFGHELEGFTAGELTLMDINITEAHANTFVSHLDIRDLAKLKTDNDILYAACMKRRIIFTEDTIEDSRADMPIQLELTCDKCFGRVKNFECTCCHRKIPNKGA